MSNTTPKTTTIRETLPAEATAHLPALDGVRGLAILLVTLYRFNGGSPSGAPGEHWSMQLTALGLRGVDLFFVLSGFLITRILLNAKHEPHYFRNFYARRAVRIFPLYFAVLFLAFVLLPGMDSAAASVFAQPKAHQIWLWLYGTNIYQTVVGDWSFGCLNHFWSLAVEEHFYFIWPLLIFMTTPRTAIWACGLVIGTAFVTRVGWLAMGGNGVAVEVFTLFRMDALAMGGLAAILVARFGTSKLIPWAKAGTWSLGLLLVVLCGLGNRRLLTIPETLIAAFFACVIVLATSARRESIWARFWNARGMRFFGKYSYGMYVFQNPLIPLLAPLLSISLLLPHCGTETAARLVYIGLMSVLTTAAAWASWHLFEKHFLALKRYFPSGTEQHKAGLQNSAGEANPAAAQDEQLVLR